MQNVCKQALRQLFGNRTKLTSFAVITDGYRNLTANVCCDAYPEHLFFKVEKSFAIPRTQKYQIEKEVAGLSLCHKSGISVPRLLAMETAPVPWLIESFLPGAPISTFSLSVDDRLRLGMEFEPIFHKLCQIRSNEYGDSFQGGFVGRHSTWQQAMAYITQLNWEDCASLSLFGNHRALVRDALEKALSQIEDTSSPTFYHCDLFSANVMGLPDERGQLHISSIIDFGMSMFAPLSYILGMTHRYCDLMEYASQKDDFPNEQDYQILRIEPLLMMKLFNYPDAEAALQRYVTQCRDYLKQR